MFSKIKIKLKLKEVSADLKAIYKRRKLIIFKPKLKDFPEILDTIEDLSKQKKILKRFKQRLLYKLEQL